MKSKSLSLGHVKINYLDNENPSDLALLFIHGNSASKESFRYQLCDEDLNKYRLVALDLPGHGQTSVDHESLHDPQTFTYDYFCRICTEFVGALGLNKVMLVGHSLGGHISIGMSDLKELQGLVISQTPPLETMADAATGFDPTQGVLEILYNPAATEEQIEHVLNLFAESDELKEELRASWKLTAPQFRLNFSSSLGSPDFRPMEISRLKKLSCPWLIIESKSDPVVNYHYFDEHSVFKGQLEVIEGTRHFPHYEKASQFNQLLKVYLSKL